MPAQMPPPARVTTSDGTCPHTCTAPWARPNDVLNASTAGIGERIRRDPGFAEQGVHRFEQAPALIVRDHGLVHGDEIGRIARCDLRRKLRIARPGDDVDAHPNVGVLDLEAVDQSGEDAALRLRRVDIGIVAIDRAAFAEEALHDDLGARVMGRAAAQRQCKGQSEEEMLHRIAAPAGTAVHAADSGTVIYTGNELAAFGNLVLIRHAGGWVTAYGHLAKIDVAKGSTVVQGQPIGTVGQTGSAPTPQLHFEIRQGAKPVDPAPFLSGRG